MARTKQKRTRSTVKLKDVKRNILVERDENGVPHVTGDSWLDVLYGLGYVHALDRATQFLFSRVVACGTAAESISDKPELLETDRFFRRVGLQLQLEQEVLDLDDYIREQIENYCEGVSDGIQSTRRSLPMWATGFRPQPWDTEAVLLVGKLLSFGGLAISQMQNERLLIELIHAGANEEALKELFAPRLDEVDFELLRQVHMSNQLSDQALDLLTDLPRLAGSNAWAVSPQRSASGHAMLASDPHLEINRLPAIWYEAVLRWGDSYVMGATLPGCPLFAVARTEKLSWGVTYMKGDTIDYFVEDCRKTDSGWQYRRGEEWDDFRIRREVIQRKGAEPLEVDYLENDLGTLEGDPNDHGPGYYLTFRWTGSSGGGGDAIGTWLKLVASENAAQAMEIARACPQPTLCFVFADRDGHIGMQGCGRFPKRQREDQGLLPLPAWEPTSHWDGFLSSSLLPRVYDPPEGFLATANEVQNPLNGPLLVTQFLPDYRKRRIDQWLAELPKATLEDMFALQYDLVSLQARELLEVFLPHMSDGELKQRFEDWDCRYDVNSHEASLFQRLYVEIIMQVYGQEEIMGWRRALYICTRAGYSTMVLAAIDHQLKNKHSAWWRRCDPGTVVRKAVERLDQSHDVPWSERNSFQFVNRFFGSGRVGRMFESKPLPMPGCHATPFQGHVLNAATHEQTFAPSYHFVADMGESSAWTNLPGGPSESPFSRFYRSDVQRWLDGDYKLLDPKDVQPEAGA